MQVRVRENNIKELKVHILNRDIDKIIETLADEQAIDAYAQAIKGGTYFIIRIRKKNSPPSSRAIVPATAM